MYLFFTAVSDGRKMRRRRRKGGGQSSSRKRYFFYERSKTSRELKLQREKPSHKSATHLRAIMRFLPGVSTPFAPYHSIQLRYTSTRDVYLLTSRHDSCTLISGTRRRVSPTLTFLAFCPRCFTSLTPPSRVTALFFRAK